MRTFNPSQSFERAKNARISTHEWKISSQGKVYVWRSPMEKVNIIRQGIPYGSIEIIGQLLDAPVKDILDILRLPQTTYNKKKRDNLMLTGRESEIILSIIELVDFGNLVFNNEEKKFQRWLKKPNISLANASPESLLDSSTGIQEVMNCLNRLESGNLA